MDVDFIFVTDFLLICYNDIVILLPFLIGFILSPKHLIIDQYTKCEACFSFSFLGELQINPCSWNNAGFKTVDNK
jgi:hypothetical protein